MIATLIVAILLAFGGGTAAAAENTLPGDLLYPIKVKVNEEVRAALAVTSEAKVAWDARRAERRLEEVEKLAEGGQLTTSTSQMLAGKFKEFSDKADARLEKLQTSGKLSEEQAQKLKENFEVAIKAHNEVLSRLQEKELEKGKLKSLVDSLRGQVSSTMKDRLEYEWELLKNNASTTLKTAAENRKNAAQNKISEVEKFIANNENKVSAENKAEAMKKLEEAKKVVAEGDQKYIEGKYGEAIIKYSEAHRQVQEAKMYMTKRFHLEKKVNTTPTSTLPDEVKHAKEKVQELKKEGKEKIKEKLKENKEKLKDSKKIEAVNTSTAGAAI